MDWENLRKIIPGYFLDIAKIFFRLFFCEINELLFRQNGKCAGKEE